MKEYKTLLDVIQNSSTIDTAKGITFISGEKEEKYVSYCDLYSKALEVLYNLQAHGIKEREELIFQLEDNETFLYTFWACLLGGIIPVPVTVGNNDEHKLKLFKIWKILNSPHLITDNKTFSGLDKYIIESNVTEGLNKIKANTIFTDQIKTMSIPGEIYKSDPNGIAFIQFSSGSTGDPKGVVLTHENLLTNVRAAIKGAKVTEEDSVLSWMPLTHDMGLIGNHMVPITSNINHYIMPTSLFIRRPALWFEKASEHRATILSSPNFGYKYFLSFFKPEIAKAWDLSYIRLILNGAEPISADLCNQFLDEMSRYGLKRTCMYTVYGMAEASLSVAYPPVGEGFASVHLDRESLNIGEAVREIEREDHRSVTFVDVGYPVEDCRIRVCDMENKAVGDHIIGYIQIKGRNVTSGYYNNREATDSVITPDGWLNTGDLGFVRNGRLVITGRAKDIIFVNGQNYYPHDIERVAEGIEGIELGKIAACGVYNHALKKEDVVVFVLFKKGVEVFAPLAVSLKEHINAKAGLEIKEVVPVRDMPKTTSGKVQRYKLGERYSKGEYSAVLQELQAIIRERFEKRVAVSPRNETERKLQKIWQDVLGIESISVNDSFFYLGGNSLKAAAILARIHKEFNVKVSAAQIFNNPTIEKFAECMDSGEEKPYSTIEPVPGGKLYYPASSAQKRLLIIENSQNAGISYNLPQAMIIHGKLDQRRFEAAFKKLIERHEILRTSFEIIDETVVQRIREDVEFKIFYGEACESETDEVIKAFIKPFKLDEAPLLRVSLIKLGKEKHLFLFDIHHIISDGTSMQILLKEIISLYEGKTLHQQKIQYKDFSAWQNELFRTGAVKQQEEYWLNTLRGELPVLNMPLDIPRPAVQSFEGGSIDFTVGSELTGELKRIASETGSTLYVVLLAAYNVLLYKYTGQEDIIVGSAIAGRPHADLEDMIGMFVNTLAMRNYPGPGKIFKEFLSEVRDHALRAYENQEYQFDELVEKLSIVRDMRRNPLFDTMFAFQNMENMILTFDELKFVHYKLKNRVAKFDLTLQAAEDKAGIAFNLEYCTKLFHKDTVQRLAAHFINVLKKIVKNPDTNLAQIDVMRDEEKRQLLFEFNNTKAAYPQNKTMHELFEEQAEKTPDNIAVVFGEYQLTYRELNERANRLACVLRAKGLKPERVAAVMVDRSVEMLVGVMGILKSGGAYLPIDPEYPEERISYMLKNSNADILIVRRGLEEKVKFDGEIIKLDDEGLYFGSSGDASNCFLGVQEIAEPSLNFPNPEKVNNSGDLAYIIYTSGSTGLPKGVMIEHNSAVNLITCINNRFNVTQNDTLLFITSICFDLSVYDIFGMLAAGGKIVMAKKEQVQNPEVLKSLLEKEKITFWDSVPTTMNYLVNFLEKEAGSYRQEALRLVFMSGDWIPVRLPGKIKNNFPNAEVISLGGATEGTVWSICYPVREGMEYQTSIPYGKPLDNNYFYILDQNRNMVPQGVVGELYIGGVGVARGYMNDEKRTGNSFAEDRFLGEGTGRMYKTGDFGRMLPDGNIEFLGRIDHQVKIRGFRVELGEIENCLLEHKSVKEAVVVDRTDSGGNKDLCAYIVWNEEVQVSVLREYLSERLPDYMLPSYFVVLDKLPLNSNGKIDRKMLPDIYGIIDAEAEYEAPVNEAEEKLAEVWRDVLGLEKIGINDNFFRLGGDSIKAIQVSSRLRKYNLSIEIKDLFQNSTIKELGKHVKALTWKIDQGIVKGTFNLTPVQKWFFEQRFTDMRHWNQAVMLYKKDGFDEESLRRAFGKLLEHHDVLRIVFKETEKGITAVNRGTEGELFTLDVQDLTAVEAYAQKIEAGAAGIHAGMDLSRGPLVKSGLFKTKEGDHLLIAIHHLAIDGVSWRILLEDFATAYEKAVKREEIVLTQKTDSYKVWSEKLKTFAVSKKLLKQIGYWNKIGETEIEPLPADYAEDSDREKDSEVLAMELSPEDTGKLLKQSNRAYNTEISELLLTALGLTVKEWSKQDKVLINLEGHGREEIIGGIDITRTVGWFTSMYPVLLDMSKADRLSYCIKAVKEGLRQIPDKGTGYGILKYLTPEESKKGLKCSLKPEISFNYLGQFDNLPIGSGTFAMSDLSAGGTLSGNAQRLYTFDINGMVSGGRLKMSFSYNRNKYKKETVLKLIECYKKALESIIEHCTAKDSVELTPSDMGDSELSIGELDYMFSLTGKNIQSIYALSPMQEGMLFHALLDTSSNAYFEQVDITIEGNLNIELLEKSFNRVIDKYDILRTNFVYENISRPRQVVLKERLARIDFKDVSHLSADEAAALVDGLKKKDMERKFDLQKDILMRMTVIKTGASTYRMIWSFHHILIDGWCISIIFKDILEVYAILLKDKPVVIEKAQPYIEYIKWLEKQDKDEARQYWEAYLEDYEQAAGLPKLPATGEKEDVYSEFRFELGEEITGRIGELAVNNEVTVNTIFQTIWGLLLQKYNNSEDVVFGAVVSGRPYEIYGVEKMVGLFINTVPVRIKCGKGMKFPELVKQIQQGAIAGKNYEYLQLADIQSGTYLRNNLINHILAFENYPVEKEIEALKTDTETGITISNLEMYEQTNYDFSVAVIPGRRLGVNIKYNRRVYGNDLVRKIEGHFKQITQKIIENSEVRRKDIDILTEAERRQILVSFNNTKTEYPGDKTIHEQFEEQVEKAPDDLVVVFKDTQLTYKELNEMANRLAYVLREKGIGPDCIVGIMAKHSLEMFIGILGVLKSGGAYLPIDYQYPEERIRYMLEDSEINILLTHGELKGKISFGGKILDLQDSRIYSGEGSNPVNVNKPTDLAYAIYTSGSTGKPKGVMVEHRALNNLCHWHISYYGVTKTDRSTKYAGFGFDASVWEIFPYVISGSTIHIIDEELKLDIHKLGQYFEDNGITISFLPTQICEQFIELENATLRRLLTGGDKLRKFKSKPYEIVNNYGPTESTVVATSFIVNGDYANIPIGRPVSNSKVYIMDKEDNLQPVGVAGELCISGDSLARGYLKRPELTEEKFVPDPFNQGKLMYRTGDLARWMPDGNIEFMGRIDHQTKIRGYRIEPEEIEVQLLGCGAVKEAIVTDRKDKDGNRHLCAYIVSDQNVTISTLKEHLSTNLPDYMIPAYFVQLDAMPLTPNGKIDRKLLPDPDARANVKTEYIKPNNYLQIALEEIWMEILGVERIGIDDDFFELGGNSIKLISCVSKMCLKLSMNIPIGVMFRNPTINTMAQYIERQGNSDSEQPVILLNNKKRKNIFAFPGIEGQSIAFMKLAKLINSHSFYSFDFIEDEDRIEQYVRLIAGIQEQGEYVLVGHSAGGNLAFEVAKGLAKRGYAVSDIILLDSYRREKRVDIGELSEKGKRDIFERWMEAKLEEGLHKDYKNKAIKKMRSYTDYIGSLVNTGEIQANIHLITSVEGDNEYKGWALSTNKTFITYKGSGEHAYMISDGYVEENAKIVKAILEPEEKLE